MNKENAINKFDIKLKWYKADQKNPIIACIKDDFESIIKEVYNDFEKDLQEINNLLSRLKKQLSKGHHLECGCSFCKPVDELKEFKFTSCDDCKNKIDGTYQEVCSNCKRFYGCYFEAKEKLC